MSTEVAKFEMPKLKAPALVYGANIGKEVQAAELMLQKVTVVETEAQKIELDAYVKAAKKTRKVGADLRLEQTRVLDTIKTAYTDTERAYFARLDLLTKNAETIINGYNNAQLAKIREEQERLRKEEQERLARLRSPVSMAKVETEFQAKKEAVTADLPTGVKMVWGWEITDLNQIPTSIVYAAMKEYIAQKGEAPEFLKMYLDNFVKTGGRQLEGVRISEKAQRTGR